MNFAQIEFNSSMRLKFKPGRMIIKETNTRKKAINKLFSGLFCSRLCVFRQRAVCQKLHFLFNLQKRTMSSFLWSSQQVYRFCFSLQESYFKPLSYFFPPLIYRSYQAILTFFLFLKTSMFSQHEPLKYQGRHSAKNNNCVRKNELFML